jgi:hypothetical protein
MTDLNGTNNSDTIILNDDKIEPTLNDILSQNNQKSLDDIITSNAEKILKTENHNDSERATLPKINIKINETEPLSMNILENKKGKESSGVIQVPTDIKSDNQKDNYNLKFSSTKSTLNESIMTTINRDLLLIYTKIKYVVNPFISRDQKNIQIRQWDLWGPLVLNMTLAFTLSFNTKEKSQMTTLIFVIFWLGGVILFLNANFLGVKTSIFQMLCLLGYCLFPLNLAAIFVTLFNFNDILRLLIVIFNLLWSIYSSSDYLKIMINPEKRYLVLYPCILFYFLMQIF